MSLSLLSSYRQLLTPLRACFPREQTFQNFLALSVALLLGRNGGQLSQALVAGGLTRTKHWSAFYRFFSRSPWSLDDLGLGVAGLILDGLVPLDEEVVLAGDDTLHAKGGAKIFGGGMHRDPLGSTRSKACFQFGHCWVVLSVVVRLPFASRPRALPILFRLNVPKKKCGDWGVEHARKTDQLVELLVLLAGKFPGRQFCLVADDAYSNRTVLEGLPSNVEMIGRLHLDAQLFDAVPPRLPGTVGRPRRWGERLPAPRQMAETCIDWPLHEVEMYGRRVEVRALSRKAWWHSAGPDRPLRVVVVWRPSGEWPYEAFFSTKTEQEPEAVLRGYSERWPLEVTFRETKQLLGANRGQPTTAKAVLRFAPFKMLLYSLLVLWYVEHGHGSVHAAWLHRPWYRTKRAPSFGDMCMTFRRASLEGRLLAEVDARPGSAKVGERIREWVRLAA